jgi:hypothetical protein
MGEELVKKSPRLAWTGRDEAQPGLIFTWDYVVVQAGLHSPLYNTHSCCSSYLAAVQEFVVTVANNLPRSTRLQVADSKKHPQLQFLTFTRDRICNQRTSLSARRPAIGYTR